MNNYILLLIILAFQNHVFCMYPNTSKQDLSILAQIKQDLHELKKGVQTTLFEIYDAFTPYEKLAIRNNAALKIYIWYKIKKNLILKKWFNVISELQKRKEEKSALIIQDWQPTPTLPIAKSSSFERIDSQDPLDTQKQFVLIEKKKS